MHPPRSFNGSNSPVSSRLLGRRALQPRQICLHRAANDARGQKKARKSGQVARSQAVQTERASALECAVPKLSLRPLQDLISRTLKEDVAARIALDSGGLDGMLRAPESAVVKEGGAGGTRLQRTRPPAAVQQQQHPALEVVRARLREGSAPGRRKDNFKVGLVVEGGGMRGVVTGAALQAMHDLGMRDAFDAVYGSSAGAINATYFLSGQRDGVNIYTTEIANERFIDLRRLLQRGKGAAAALDLDYLLGVIREKRPLDWNAVLASPVPLKVVASCLDTLQPVILEGFTSPEDLEICLRASANVPEVAGRPILHRGKRLVDAAVFEPVPFRAAIADGCTHIVSLCSRPPFQGGYVAKILDSLVSDLVKRLVLNPEYMRAAWMREIENSLMFGMTTDEMLVSGLQPGSNVLPHFGGTHVYPLFPGDAAQAISPLCISVPLLEAGLEEGRAMVLSVFGPSADTQHSGCAATAESQLEEAAAAGMVQVA